MTFLYFNPNDFIIPSTFSPECFGFQNSFFNQQSIFSGRFDFSFIPNSGLGDLWNIFRTSAPSSNITKKTEVSPKTGSSNISQTAYDLAMKGYKNLKDKGNGYLGIVDPNTNTYYLYDMKGNKPKLIGSTSVKFGSGNMDTVANANRSGSHATLSGFTKVSEEYSTSKWTGIGIRFDGLEQGINNNARAKATVIHCTKGNSTWGCIGVTPEYKGGKVDNSATNNKIRRLFPKGTIMFTCPTNAGMNEYKHLSALV